MSPFDKELDGGQANQKALSKGDSQQMLYRGFFSYAHADSKTDMSVFDALTEELEARVQQRLVNANFELWRDTKRLRTADRWEKEIEDAVRSADVFVAAISPSWMSSKICLKEYNIYLEREKIGKYPIPSILPVIIRDVHGRSTHFNDQQMEVYADVKSRQFTRKDIVEIAQAPVAARSQWIDKIADDIEGIIEKLRCSGNLEGPDTAVKFSRVAERKEYSQKAFDFRVFDFVADADIAIRGNVGEGAKIVGQIDFLDRLYIDTPDGRVEFGIKRALLSLKEEDHTALLNSEHIRNSTHVRYVVRHADPKSLVVCIEPPIGRTSLGELALPPGPSSNENRLCELAIVTPSTVIGLTATIAVTVNTEGVFLRGQKNEPANNSQMAKVQAILDVALEKYSGTNGSLVERALEVRDERGPKSP